MADIATYQDTTDRFGFKVYHDGLASAEAWVNVDVQSWNFPPVVHSQGQLISVNREPITVNLTVADYTKYVGMYIMTLPTKGNYARFSLH